jgi:hypothetical protein
LFLTCCNCCAVWFFLVVFFPFLFIMKAVAKVLAIA